MTDAPTMKEIAARYTPLVRAAAKRYQGRGAEFEDLVQEGYLALILLTGKCRNMKWLPLFLKKRLPAAVRDAAARIRRTCPCFDGPPVEEIEETHGGDDENYSESELRETLRRALSPAELDITQALMEGFTQREIARALGISQQAVAARLKIIRRKLKEVIDSVYGR